MILTGSLTTVQSMKKILALNSQDSCKDLPPCTTFNTDFGNPIQPLQAGKPASMAILPAEPGAIVLQQKTPPTTAVPKAIVPKHSSRGSAARHSATVHAKLLNSHPHNEPATPQIAGYTTGYVPEGLPTGESGYSTIRKTDVRGYIVQH